MDQPSLCQDEVSVHHPPADLTESALCCGCQKKTLERREIYRNWQHHLVSTRKTQWQMIYYLAWHLGFLDHLPKILSMETYFHLFFETNVL